VLIGIAFVLSGAAGLGYQIAWTRLFAPGLGHEIPSLLAVVGAFFGGFALGAWLLDRPINRSAHPQRWYAALEALIGLWAIASAGLIPLLNARVASWTGPEPTPLHQWGIAFIIPALALLPATAAMGATLAAMERTAHRLRPSRRSLAGVYAANTFGAVVGTLASTFILLPAMGFRMSLLTLAVANFAAAAIVLACLRRAPAPATADPTATLGPAPLTMRRYIPLLVFTGLLGIGYEVLAVRIMAQALESTIYTYASSLSVYLMGTALGAALYHRFGRRFGFRAALTAMLIGLSCAVSIGAFAMEASIDIYELLRRSFGADQAGSIAAEMILASIVLGPATILMGATFSHLAEAAPLVFRRAGAAGTALAWNTAGGALAAAIFVVVLLPAIGSTRAIMVLALGYAALVVVAHARPVAALRLAVLPAIVAALVLTVDLRLVRALPGGRVLDVREGVLGTSAIIADAEGRRTLKIDNKFSQGGATSVFIQRRQAHIPLLLHPAPRTSLFLGLGSGSTIDAAGVHPGLRATGVELVPEVLELLPAFDDINPVLADPGQQSIRLRVADARRFVRASDEQFDVIVADLFHPARDGAGSLYTREHFQAIRNRLAPGALFCQWLPLHQLDEATARSVIRTFLDVYPDATAWIASFNVQTPALGLIGTTDRPPRWPPSYFAMRVTDRALLDDLMRQAIRGDVTLFGTFIAGPAGLSAFAADAPLNTDDRPFVTFRAPRFAYAGQTPPWRTLSALLKSARPDPAEILEQASSAAARIDVDLLGRFLNARDRFLAGSIAMAEGRTDEALAAWIDSARISQDFATGAESALDDARRRMTADPARARATLAELVRILPRRQDIRDLLNTLDATATPPNAAPDRPSP